MRNPELIDLRLRDAAAFALYKHEHPESIAESWETVGLPIVLEYRDKANVVLVSYFVPALLPFGGTQ